MVQREWMNSGVCHYRDWSLNPVEWIAIWLDILSIPQSNRGVQKLAVDSLYVYAAAVSALVIIAPDSKHESTGDDAGLESYKSRVCMAWL